MHDIVTFSHEDFAQYAAKIKFMSGIKVNVTSMPHDGRFSFDHVVDDERSSIDVRINTMPSLYGDDIVIRYLDSSIGVQSFEELGVRDIHYQRIKTSMSHQHGLILVTGPT
jgi:type II secretory ATPase GspE/PulE/Tfp pilus assembly ATPase PilB-like protein